MPVLILKNVKCWNSFQSFQFQYSAKPPALARSGGQVWIKIKLKNFYDPKTAGGCGVVRFLSAKDFFCHAVTRQRSAVGTICFQGGADCLKGWNTPERCWLRVVKSVCEDREETFPVVDEGHKKTRFRGLCSGQVYLPITGEYLPFSVSAFAPVLLMAPALVGAPVLLCVWHAISQSSSACWTGFTGRAIIPCFASHICQPFYDEWRKHPCS